MTITELIYDIIPIPDIARLEPNTDCACRNGDIVQYIGAVQPLQDDCYVFCAMEGRPFRVYADGRYIFRQDNPQDVIGTISDKQ